MHAVSLVHESPMLNDVRSDRDTGNRQLPKIGRQAQQESWIGSSGQGCRECATCIGSGLQLVCPIVIYADRFTASRALTLSDLDSWLIGIAGINDAEEGAQSRTSVMQEWKLTIPCQLTCDCTS
jgi:hypothetical protein